MSGAKDGQPPPPPQLESAAAIVAAFAVYLVVFLVAVVWLVVADRTAELPPLAFGTSEPWVAMTVGLVATAVGVPFCWLCSRSARSVRHCESRLAELLGTPRDGVVVMLPVTAAIAEELLFRCVLQGAFGPWRAVALQVGMSIGLGFWGWWPIAAGLGALSAWLVDAGYGLASATLAHALINYLTLRRILSK